MQHPNMNCAQNPAKLEALIPVDSGQDTLETPCREVCKVVQIRSAYQSQNTKRNMRNDSEAAPTHHGLAADAVYFGVGEWDKLRLYNKSINSFKPLRG